MEKTYEQSDLMGARVLLFCDLELGSYYMNGIAYGTCKKHGKIQLAAYFKYYETGNGKKHAVLYKGCEQCIMEEHKKKGIAKPNPKACAFCLETANISECAWCGKNACAKHYVEECCQECSDAAEGVSSAYSSSGCVC